MYSSAEGGRGLYGKCGENLKRGKFGKLGKRQIMPNAIATVVSVCSNSLYERPRSITDNAPAF